MISEGDRWLSVADDRHSKSSHKRRTQQVKSAAEDRHVPSQTQHDEGAYNRWWGFIIVTKDDVSLFAGECNVSVGEEISDNDMSL